MSGIVDRLRVWVQENADRLTAAEISLQTMFPDPDSSSIGKASIGLKNSRWLVQYTVWDGPILQSSLDMMENTPQGQPWARDTQPRDVGSVDRTLEVVLTGMITNDFGPLGPADSFVYEDLPNV